MNRTAENRVHAVDYHAPDIDLNPEVICTTFFGPRLSVEL